MARVEGGAVILDTDWPGLKAQIDNRNVNFKYEEDSTAYQIFAIDGQYFYSTVIYKAGQAPQNQATYDTWRAEFEGSYKDRVTDFNSTQPFYISNVDGYSIILKDGATPTANDGYGIAIIGYDGSNYRMMKSDSSGRPVLVGAGTAGAPTGGIITIQGDPSGTATPISGTVSISGTVTVTGTVTATNPSVGSTGSTTPASATLVGGTDGTNLQPARFFDLDTGGGQQFVMGVGLRKAAGGGSVEAGTSSDPLRIDPTGATTQPISGTVTANQGGSWTVAATQSGTWTVQPGNTANTTPWLATISQGGNSATVTASNALKIDGSAVTQPVSGTVTANAGTGNFTVVQSTAANLRAQLASESATGSGITSTAVLIGGSDGTNLRSIFLDSSGRQIIIGAAANGAAVAGNPVLIAGSDGTNARSVRTANDGTVRVDPTGSTTQPVSGTVTANAGTGNFTVVQATAANLNATVIGTITANIGTTNGLALDTTLAKLTIAQGTALGSNTQALIGGSVTTAAPTYTTGQISPISLTTTGAIRIDGSGVTQPVSGTVTATQSGTWTVQPGNTANTTPWLTTISQGGNSASVSASNALKVDGSAVTQPVSGTVTANQGGAPWSQNVTQFGGVNISTGTGASGTGIPRVTVANDSNILATQSGTWTVQPGNTANTTPWLVTDSSDGPVTPGTVAGKSSLMGGQFNTALPTLTNTQQSAIQLDSSGRILIGAIPTGANVIGAVTQSGSWTVTANAGTGNFSVVGTGTDNTTNSTAKLPVLAAVSTTGAPTYTTGNMVPLSVDTSGNLRITGSISATNPSVSTTGTAPPASATYIGGSVTTAAPTYTTGQMDPLSLTTAGALRVDGSGVTQPVSGTVTSNQGTANTLANGWPVKITDGTNTMPTGDVVARAIFQKITDGTNTAAVKAASTAAVAADPALVVAVSPNNTLPTQVADVTATGALGALNAAVQVTLAGHTSAGFQLAAGTLVGTILAEASFDGGTTWTSTYMDTGNKVSTIVFGSANTATSATIIGVGGSGLVRVRVSAYTSGTANITVRTSVVNDPSVVYAGLADATVQPPTASQIAGWDSATTTLRVPAVKAASTVPAVGDQALVVILSPNQQAIPVSSSPATSTPAISAGTVTTSATTKTAVRASTFLEQTTNAKRSFKSSSANDTSAGTGARTIILTYYDQTMAGPSTETITLNGTAAVNTVSTTIAYVESIIVATAGSTLSNVGAISMFTTTAGGGSTMAVINATDNKTFYAHHYVATGKTCYITGLSGNNNSSSNGSILTLSSIDPTSANSAELQISDFVRVGGGTSQPVRGYNQLIKVVGPSRILCYEACEGTPVIITRAAFDYYDQ